MGIGGGGGGRGERERVCYQIGRRSKSLFANLHVKCCQLKTFSVSGVEYRFNQTQCWAVCKEQSRNLKFCFSFFSVHIINGYFFFLS